MGMSYKCAWLLLDSLNAAFEPRVVTTTLGGPGGSGARERGSGHDEHRDHDGQACAHG
jgi:molybdate transport system regulatory protein